MLIKKEFLEQIADEEPYGEGMVELSGKTVTVPVVKEWLGDRLQIITYGMNRSQFTLGIYDTEKGILYGYEDGISGYVFEESPAVTIGPSRSAINTIIVQHLFVYFADRILNVDGTLDNAEIRAFCGKEFYCRKEDEIIAMAMGALTRRPDIDFMSFIIDEWLDKDVFRASWNSQQLKCYFYVGDIRLKEYGRYMEEKDLRPDAAIAPFVHMNEKNNEKLIGYIGILQKSFSYAKILMSGVSADKKEQYLKIMDGLKGLPQNSFVQVYLQSHPISIILPKFQRRMAPDHLWTSSSGVIPIDEIEMIKVRNKILYRGK